MVFREKKIVFIPAMCLCHGTISLKLTEFLLLLKEKNVGFAFSQRQYGACIVITERRSSAYNELTTREPHARVSKCAS
jgi:hypothetical protein